MNYTKGEIKTLGDAWKVLKEHGLEGSYCPHCDQFSQAIVLQKQDKLISEMYEALKVMREQIANLINPQIKILPSEEQLALMDKALAKAEGK